jgi:hypothetical protein
MEFMFHEIYIFAFSNKTEEKTKEILAQRCITSSTKKDQQESSKLQCPLGSLTLCNEGILL